MDEMEKSIRTRSEALGYKFAVLLLATWTLVNLVLYLATGGAREMPPTLVLIAVLLAQGFSEESMKRRMVEGDDEYHEPRNRTVRIVVGVLGVALVTFFAGFLALYAA